MVKFRWEKEFRETPIGKIPRDWEIEELGKLATIKTGKTNVQDAVPDGPYPLFDRSEIPKRSNKYLFDTEAVIVPGEGQEFFPKYYVGKFDLHQRTYAIFNFEEDRLLGKFLYYCMHILRYHLRERAVGSTVASLRLPIFQKLEIPLPKTEEQQRIATVLSWFDDLIENKRRQNEILEKVAMAIFKSWFIDFEPFQDEEFVYSEELDMEIPKGWEVKPIGEVAEFTNGLSYKGSEKFSEYVDGTYVFITLNNINEGGGFKPEYAWIKSTRLKQRHFLREEDLIFANTEQTKSGRLLGSPAFVIFPPGYEQEKGVYSHHITKVMPFSEEIKEYLYLIFRTYQKVIANTYHTGTGVWGFDLKNFKENYYIPVPPKQILEKFHSLVEPLFRKIIINEKEIMVLKRARDTLLPQLVFGRLRVEEV